MTAGSTSSSSSSSPLKALLTRPAPLELSREDVQLLLPHLDPSSDSHSLVLAVLSRSTSPTLTPSRTTLQSIQATLESLLSGTDSTELVQGLSLLSALLQVSPSFVTSSLFIDNKRLSKTLRDAVQHISSPIVTAKGKEKQDEEELALVELLSLASGQPGMRQLVEESAGDWLEGLLDRRGTRQERMRAMAGVGIVKLRMGKKETTTGLPQQPEPERPTKWKLDDIGELFIDIAVAKGKEDERTLLACLEGLAYLTLTHSRKMKQLAASPRLLSLLFVFSDNKDPASTSAARDFAIATLLNHLTSFPTAEDAQSDAAQVERLKRFASAGGGAGDSATNDKESVQEVTARVSLIVQHSPSPIPTIRQFCLSPSLQTRRLAGSILHSLVTPQAVRGQLLQAGIHRLLLSLIRNIPAPFDVAQDLAPVQALSKLLITANPLLIFGPTPSSPLLFEATTALTLPFNTLSSTPLLAIFESLMALTNVASLDPELTDKIARLQLRDKSTTTLLNAVEELLLHQNTMVRRAATELICNLVGSEPGIIYFEPTSPSSSSRLHILLALSSSEDVPTRLAATGALTSLVYSPSISISLATNDKFLDLLLALLDDDEPGVRHRGYEVWRGMEEVIDAIEQGDESRRKAVEKLKERGAIEKLNRAKGKETVIELRESIAGAPLEPRAVDINTHEQTGSVENDQEKQQSGNIGMILGCVAVGVLILFGWVGLVIWRRRKREATRGTRLLDPVYEVPSTELVPWLTQGSPTQTRLVQQFSSLRDPLLPPTPGFTAPVLPPSPTYSRLPQNGHHSANPSIDSDINLSEATEAVGTTMTEVGSGTRRGEVQRQETSSTVLSEQPPPYSSGTTAVGVDLSSTRAST